jgi:hypothetical protein
MANLMEVKTEWLNSFIRRRIFYILQRGLDGVKQLLQNSFTSDKNRAGPQGLEIALDGGFKNLQVVDNLLRKFILHCFSQAGV